MMNPTCPRTGRICFDCKLPCIPPEINPAWAAMPQAEKPFAGIFAALSERFGFEQTDEEINKITITTRL